jgi:hypothetical protein
VVPKNLVNLFDQRAHEVAVMLVIRLPKQSQEIEDSKAISPEITMLWAGRCKSSPLSKLGHQTVRSSFLVSPLHRVGSLILLK